MLPRRKKIALSVALHADMQYAR